MHWNISKWVIFHFEIFQCMKYFSASQGALIANAVRAIRRCIAQMPPNGWYDAAFARRNARDHGSYCGQKSFVSSTLDEFGAGHELIERLSIVTSTVDDGIRKGKLAGVGFVKPLVAGVRFGTLSDCMDLEWVGKEFVLFCGPKTMFFKNRFFSESMCFRWL